jgi:protein SCO1/2
MSRTRLALWLTIGVLGMITTWLVGTESLRRARAVPEPLGFAGPFTLTAHDGQRFRAEDLLGSVWVADFIFTRCQGPCPLMTLKMGALERETAAGAPVRFVSFSVDPRHDTPAVLRAYRKDKRITSTRWVFLTGKPVDVLKVVRERFRLPVVPAEDPTVIIIPHSEKFAMVDAQGSIRGYYDSNDPRGLEALRRDLQALIRQP